MPKRTLQYIPEEIWAVMKSPSESDKALIAHACSFAQKAHEGQTRMSGEPYFTHVFETGMNLAELKMDAATIAAGILHDTLEDCDIDPHEFEKEFGKEILFLVEGVTKLGKLKYKGAERHAESLRKFFVATAEDVRVATIKLADRLHNISTLSHVKPEKQRRIALETLEIHARLADRLGIGKLKAALEDYAFPYAFPKEYEETNRLFNSVSHASEEHLEHVAKKLREELEILGVRVVRMDRRVKHLYSLWQKLKRYDMDINKVYDIVALRIIVPDITACYQTLGVIHGLYRPLPGRFKDYIAVPKPNGYRSLHTTVFDGAGGTFEVQIRTEDMHLEAEYGIASHLHYKEIGKDLGADEIQKKATWTQELLRLQSEAHEGDDFIKNLKVDFFENRLFVYTPKGDVIELPEGASAIDFAYAIHSDIGNHMSGAKVNGKLVSLDTILKRGDIVEVVRNEKAKPNRKWIDMTKTTLAKRHIRSYLKEHGSTIDKMFLK